MQICACLRLRARGVDCFQRGIGNFCGDGHVTVLDWGGSSTALYNCLISTNYTLKMRGLYSFYTFIGEKWKKSQPVSSSSWQQDIGTYFKCPSYSYHGPLYKWVNLFFNSTVGHLQGFFLLIGSMGLRHFCTNLWSTFASISYKLRYQFRWVIEYVHFSNIYKHVGKPHCSTSLPILGMIGFKNFKSAGLISLELAFPITKRVEIFFHVYWPCRFVFSVEKLWAHHEKPRFFETETMMLGKIEGCKKRGKPNLRGTDSIKEAIDTSLQELSRAIGDRTSWTPLIQCP